MPCNCINEVQEKLTKLMVEQNKGCEIVEEVTFSNTTFVFGKEQTMEILGNPVLGKYRINGKVKKWTMSMFPSFCPFCGKRLKEESAPCPK